MDANVFIARNRRGVRRWQRKSCHLLCLVAVTFSLPIGALAGHRGNTAGDNSGGAQLAASSAANPNASTTPTAGSSTLAGQPHSAIKPNTTKSVVVKAEVGKSDTTKSDAANLSADSIAAQIKDLEGATDADQPNRAALLDLYRQALDDINHADEQKTRAAELEKQRIAAPYQLEIHKREQAAKSAKQPPLSVLPSGATLAVWEQMLDSAEQELQAAQKTADEKEKEQQQRAARRLEIPQAIAAARIKLDELEQTPADGSAPSGDTAAIIQARHIARQAQKLALETEISLAEQELKTYDNAAAELLSAQLDAADETAQQLENRVATWREAVNHRREADADEQAAQAHLAAATAVPAIRQLADENSNLANRRAQLTKAIEQLADDRESVVVRLDKVVDQFKQATDKLNVTGLTEAVGQMLLKQRSELATIEADRRAAKVRQLEIARVQMELFEFQEQLGELHNLDSSVEEFRASLPKNAEANRTDLRRLLETKRKYLEALIEDDNSYFAALVDVDSKQRELLTQADSFREYIDQRVLWIRSTHPLSFTNAGKSWGAAAWLARPANWWAAVCELASAAGAHPAWIFLATLVFIPWIWGQRRLRIAILNRTWVPNADGNLSGLAKFHRAFQTALATLLIAAILPSLLWFVGWLLDGGSAGHGEFPEALGAALQITAAALLPILLIRQICRHGGLAEAHFGWPGDVLVELRKELTRLALIGAPAAMIVTMLESQSTAIWKDSLGRLAFIAGQLLVAGFVFVVLRPPHGALHRLMVLRSSSLTSRLSLPAFLALLIFPLALATLAIAGYYYTALRLACRLQTTVWLVLGVVIAQALISIWLTGMYRRLAVKAAGRIADPTHRFTISAQNTLTEPFPREAEKSAAADKLPDIDLEDVDTQTQQLLHNLATLALAVGLCLIWVDMFPALQFFNQITLPGDSEITLANVLEAGIVAALTLVAASNLPSLLDIAVLQRMMPDRGSRYALVAVIRYAIVVIGIAVAGATVGIGWAKLQWLVAAMSFGLGFGLQEIFANFVSGLIVLLERPVRVGDTVTVGDVTGVVSRIRMRATTIVDADRKELILPNKDLVSGRLVNWTLTDSVVRLVVRLGIAYGSDTAQAQRLLLEVASKTPEVLKTPPPKAVFMGFGEKSLDFELRVFVSNVETMLPVRHQLNMAIDRTFHAAGVEIAFAQADTYIRSRESAHPRASADAKGNSMSAPQNVAESATQKAA